MITNKILYNHIILNAKLNNTIIKCIVDTGANSSYINKNKIDEFLNKNIKCYDTYVHGFNDKHKINSILYDVYININDMNLKTNLLIIDKLDNKIFDAVIGLDFIKKHNILIDYCNNALVFGNNNDTVILF